MDKSLFQLHCKAHHNYVGFVSKQCPDTTETNCLASAEMCVELLLITIPNLYFHVHIGLLLWRKGICQWRLLHWIKKGIKCQIKQYSVKFKTGEPQQDREGMNHANRHIHPNVKVQAPSLQV